MKLERIHTRDEKFSSWHIAFDSKDEAWEVVYCLEKMKKEARLKGQELLGVPHIYKESKHE